WPCQPQERVDQTLAADRGAAALTRRGGAKGPGAVRGVHDDLVAERQDPVVQRPMQLTRQTERVLVAEQVGACDRTDEQAAAAEQDTRCRWAARIFGQVAEVFRRVAGCGEDRQLDLANLERVTVPHRLVIEFERGEDIGHDARARPSRQLTTAADKIVVDVRLAYVGDAHTFTVRGVEVLIHIAERVDEHRGGDSLRDQQMSVVAQAVIVELPNPHGGASVARDGQTRRAPLGKALLEAAYTEAMRLQDLGRFVREDTVEAATVGHDLTIGG